jgi:hypothetical protein
MNNRVDRRIAPPPSHTTVRTFVHGGFCSFNLFSMIAFGAFAVHGLLARRFQPYIRFLCVITVLLPMASFRFAVTRNILAIRYCFLPTRRMQGLAP